MKIFKRLFILIVTFSILFTNNYFVQASQPVYYVGGFALGFDLNSNGALVVGLTDVVCEDGIFQPAREAGINCGDYILSINGTKITRAEDIDLALKGLNGEFIVVELVSKGERSIKNVQPKKDITGNYKIGVLIRDYLSGIGTVTIINEDMLFSSLGHPILDEENQLLRVSGGTVFGCKIIGAIKGERGKAGELAGQIIRTQSIGEIYANTPVGLIGKINDKNLLKGLEKMQIGKPMPGKAQIYTTICREKPQKYDVSIVKTCDDKNNKDLVIKVTDDRLIKYTGGIVQGMSGSPIVQDGKIVGAITHVFLNDGTRGYGIDINKIVLKIDK